MSILQQVSVKVQNRDADFSLITRTKSLVAKLSTSFWFCLSFLLYIVMGPFSAIAVLIGLLSLALSDEYKDLMVEPVNIEIR